MDIQTAKASGIFILIGILLITTTMVLHPVGGSFEHILKIRKINMISHGIAILSIPFLCTGFYGLSKILNKNEFISRLAFIFMSFGLIAVMIAAAINGIVLSLFLNKLGLTELQNNEAAVKVVTTYGFMFNQAMDYIFMSFSLISIGIWSVLMLKEIFFSKLLAYLGIVLFLGLFVLLIGGIDFIKLNGFRLFIASIVVWYLCTAIKLIKYKS